MDPASSVSEIEQFQWEYIRPGLGRTGRSQTEDNFAKENRGWYAILLREVLQNALDARISPADPVTVSLAYREFDADAIEWMGALVTDEHLIRLKESMPHVDDKPAAVKSCLVIEDFGTCGLTGVLDDPELDGRGQNWNAFWFREGEGGKENAAGNGGAGQGKITYFSTSAIRTIFAYTVRSDTSDEALMGACSFLRDYSHGGQRWKRDAYWGRTKGEHEDRIVLPAQDRDVIDSFRTSLKLKRNPEQAGLSLAIPSPKEFDKQVAKQIVIAEFFVPLLRGDLIVEFDDQTIGKDNVEELAGKFLSDERARELHTCMTAGYRKFLSDSLANSSSSNVVTTRPIAKVADIAEVIFDPEVLEDLREKIENEKTVSIRLPVSVKPKKEAAVYCSFDVHLACPFDLERPEQAIIRRDLLIGEEPIGGGKLRQKARGLTLIGNDALSKLLLAAEEPTHLRWNASRPRVNEYFKSGRDTVALVRNAMARLLDVLTGGEQKRDFRLLSKYFSAPGFDSPMPTKGNRKGKDIPPPPTNLPPPKPKLLALEALDDGCRIKPAKAGALTADNIPLDVTVEFAYEGLEKDAFNEYDPFDFDLADSAFAVAPVNCVVNERSLNRLSFTVISSDFELKLNGFDRNLRLRMRLSYEEKSDAATVDTE
ncbi:hypothetical protein [Pseudoxanthomonas sp. z9]|uniref:hypothetical protein n=1 Tax=Pseudoxanthomonas sp. z9 TaxID=2584942 RepID=UPI001143219B|nr:hypothetical protein [Pseudoxanthomonas sp. z9]